MEKDKLLALANFFEVVITEAIDDYERNLAEDEIPDLGGPIICHLAPDYVLRDDTEIRKGYVDGDPEGYSLFRHTEGDGWSRTDVFGGKREWAIAQAFLSMRGQEQKGQDE
jgi:hypothetical protein